LETAECMPKVAKGRSGSLNADVFVEIEGGGSGQAYPVVLTARGGLPKTSGGGKSRTSLSKGRGHHMVGL
jgi:hypothetical protein